MKKLELKTMNVEELSKEELMICKGGATGTTFWYDVFWVLGIAAHGVEVFATEGGQNAGLCVK